MLTHVHELLLEQLNQLKNLKNDEIIVVEGKNDMRALRKLGIDSSIFLLNNRYKSLVERSESLAKSSRVILLLDTDQKGQELTKQMQNHLKDQCVHVNTKLGKTLLRTAGCRTVESLASVLNKTG